jgi:excisionase family DNA binding protein
MHNHGTAVSSKATQATLNRPLSVAEIATELGVHKTTVYREIKAGRLAAYRIGTGRGAVRVPAAAFAEYRQTITAAASVVAA